MSFSLYQDYCDSGVDWLGRVPSHWAKRPLGVCFQERREKVSDTEFPPLSVTKNGIVPQIDTAAKTDDNDNRKCVRAGDFVINSRSDRKGSSGVATTDGSVSLINTVLRPTHGIDVRFVHHLFRSVNFQEEFYRFGKGIVADLWSTNYSAMKNIWLAIPPLEEQQAIATFLDRETSKIDALVAEQRRLIELLSEKRQAVISHAVTKGLDAGVRMKPSGIEWLGDVPEGWEVTRVKSISSFITSGPRGWGDRISESGSLFIQSGDLNETLGIDFSKSKMVDIEMDAEASRTQLFDGDVIVCVTGAKTGNVAVCSGIPHVGYVNQHLCLIRPTESVNSRYLGITLKSNIGQTYFDFSQYGLKQGLSLEDVRNAPVFLPSLQEQSEIVQFVDSETHRFDGLHFEAEQAISLLQERRTALISAAVTGKIDVRDAALQEAA